MPCDTCEFIPSPITTTHLVCAKCGAKIERGRERENAAPGSCQPAERVIRTDCRHLGEQSRLIGCDTCGDGVSIKAFKCAIHGECTIEIPLAAGCCATCRDYERAE